MGINKNFVVKNGFEVSTDLILANANTRKVGIASTNPQRTLDVLGGIGATDLYVAGLSTVTNEFNVGTGGTVLTVLGISGSVGVGTAAPTYLLDIRSPVSTGQTALYVQGDVVITGDLSVDDITFDDATLTDLTVTNQSALYNLSVSGFSTVSNRAVFSDYVNIEDGLIVTGTGITATTLNVTGVATANAYYIGGTQVISSARQLQNIVSLDATTTATIEAAIANGPNTFTDIAVTGISTFVGLATFNGGLQVVSGITTLGVTTATNVTAQNLFVSGISTLGTVPSLYVSGISTLGTVQVSSGIVTATTGIVTYYGDGRYLQNILSGVGINTAGGNVGFGATILDLRGPGISTVTVSSGIATINITGGGSGGASIGIGTTPGAAGFPVGVATAGNLWYNSSLARMFIYYDDGTSAQWVDAAPFNVTGNYLSKYGDFMLAGLGVTVGAASTPSVYFNGDATTGFFSPAAGEFTVVSVGASILNINPSGIRVTGVATATDFDALSDINYKENINTVNNALFKVEQLRGVKFDWKESGLPSYGVIAQELEEVLPELVHGNNPKTVNYNGIIGVLIEAIKELKLEVEELKDQLNK